MFHDTFRRQEMDNPFMAVGNVCNLQVLPRDFAGEPNKGHLIFNASFECGNLGRVDFVSDNEYDLFIRPDICSPRHRIWFYFSVRNTRANQRGVFNIVNFSKTKSLYRDGMAPVVRSKTRPQWQRMPSQHVRFDKSAAHNGQLVVSFSFAFDKEDDVYYFAYCFPFSYADLQYHLTKTEKRKLNYFYREVLTRSEQGRRVDLITITDPRNLRMKTQRLIFITARVHSGESPASFICQGLIDFLISSDPVAAILRENFVFKIIPMLNPDGVCLGNGRCSSLGYDLNRHWQHPSEEFHPSIFATKNLLMKYQENSNMRVDFFIDLHSHSQQLNSFMYGNAFYNDSAARERQAILPTLLSVLASDFSLDFTQFDTDPSKAGTGRRAVAEVLNERSLCFTFEVSIFGYRLSEKEDVVPYTEKSYQKLGEMLARSFYQFLEVERGERTVNLRSFITRGSDYQKPAITAKADSTAITDKNPSVRKCSTAARAAKQSFRLSDNRKSKAYQCLQKNSDITVKDLYSRNACEYGSTVAARGFSLEEV